MNIKDCENPNAESGNGDSKTSLLFTPYKIGPLTLRNRTIRPPPSKVWHPAIHLPICCTNTTAAWLPEA